MQRGRIILGFLFVLVFPQAKADLTRAENLAEFKTLYAKYTECTKTKAEACIETAKAALEYGKKVYEYSSKNIALLTANYGGELIRKNNNNNKNKEKAYEILQGALKLSSDAFGKNSKEVLNVLADLAQVQMNLVKIQKTGRAAYGSRAVKLSAKLNGKDSIVHGLMLRNVGSYMMLGYGYNRRLARNYLKDAYTIYKRELGEEHQETGYIALNLGKYYMAAGHSKKAVDYFNVALSSFDVTESRNSLALITHGFLVRLHEEMGNGELATVHCLAIGAANPIGEVEDYYPLYKNPPKYPRTEAKQRIEGYVLIQYTVSEQGFIENPQIIDWSGSESFVEPSLEAVKKFRYAPSFIDGKPVKTHGVRNRFSFKMGS